MGMVGAESEEGTIGFATNMAISPTNLDEKIKVERWICYPHIWYVGTLWANRMDDDAGSHIAGYHPSPIP